MGRGVAFAKGLAQRAPLAVPLSLGQIGICGQGLR